MAEPVLALDGIETCYGLSQVLFGVSLAIAPGEMVTLMGRNGMGKTTTVRSIMGLTPAAAGNIRFNGVQIHGLPAYRIAKLGLGLVPEGRHGRSQKYSHSFRGSPNVQARWPICSPAASSRCWRSVAR